MPEYPTFCAFVVLCKVSLPCTKCIVANFDGQLLPCGERQRFHTSPPPSPTLGEGNLSSDVRHQAQETGVFDGQRHFALLFGVQLRATFTDDAAARVRKVLQELCVFVINDADVGHIDLGLLGASCI